MKNNKHTETVARYFSGQNNSQAELVAGLFATDGEVHNVNLPPVKGREGILAFCQNLYARTERRRFEITALAEKGAGAFAEWAGEFTFRKGAKLGPFELAEGFSVGLRGVNKFEFDEAGQIKCLRVYHETSTVGQLALQHAKKA